MKVIGNTWQMPEEWIRDDVHEIMVQTGRMPKLVYLMNQADAGGVILRTGAHVTRGWMDSFQLHTECGPVDIISDVGCPVGRAHRMYRCPCGQLYSDDSSHSGKCVNCMMTRVVEQVEELGSKPDHWNLDADMRARLKGAALGDRAARADVSDWSKLPNVVTFCGLPIASDVSPEEFYDRMRADIGRSHIPVVTIDLAMDGTTPEKLSGARLDEPSFDYAKAMRAMEISRDLGAANRLHDRGVYQSPPCSVGDVVRWWPDGHDDGQALVDRYIDGTVTTMRPLCIKVTGSHGFLERVMGGYRMPAHGGVVDTSVSPGTVQRLNPGTPPKPPTVKTPWMRVGSPCDPLDVEYDDITLRELLCRDQIMRQSDCRGSDNAPWPSFTTVQRAAVSAHWSAELRAKVKAGAAEDKARAPSVMVDHED